MDEGFEAFYNQMMNEAWFIFKSLENIIHRYPEPYGCEGSVWCGGGGSIEKNEDFEHKRKNLFKLAMNATSILEIGFNVGHSTAIMLLANPYSTICVFDLGEHPYTIPAFNYLKSVFGRRLRYICLGDSTVTLPQFINQNPFLRFDLLHIDGGHTEDVLTSDFENCNKLASRNHVLVIDDDKMPVIHDFNRSMIKKNRIRVYDAQTLYTLQDGEMDHFVCKYYEETLAIPDTELVICRYGKQIPWIHDINLINKSIYIHDKGGEPLEINVPYLYIKQIPNLGVDQYSNIRYIVDNYEKLPNIIIFAHDDLQDHTDLYDDVGCDTMKLFLNDRIEMMINDAKTYGHSKNASRWLIMESLRPRYILDFIIHDAEEKTNEVFGDWFLKYIRPGFTDWDNMLWYKNAIFAVKKEYILSRPKDDYVAIMNQFVSQRNVVDHYMERAWYYFLNLDKPIETLA